MSCVSDQIRRLDAQLDKLQLIQIHRITQSGSSSPASEVAGFFPTEISSHDFQNQFYPTEHAKSLQRIIRKLSISSECGPTIRKLIALLKEANISPSRNDISSMNSTLVHYRYESELEWLLLSKAAIQTYGIVLSSLVDQTLPLSEDLFYWDEVLSNHLFTTLYWLQTSPYRLARLSKEIFEESLRRLELLRTADRNSFVHSTPRSDSLSPENKDTENIEKISTKASRFYRLVKNTILDRAYLYHLNAVSPLTLARNEIRQKQANIRKLHEMQASALGVLIGEGLSFEFDEEGDEWRGIIERAVLLMENVIRNVHMVDHTLDEFEETVFIFDGPHKSTDEPKASGINSLSLSTSHEAVDGRASTAALSTQLQGILLNHLPAQATAAKRLIYTYGRPGVLTRYWLPASAMLLSSTTILRILINRRQGIDTWIRELGATTLDFWRNWVVEPVRKIMVTIRHSEDSEVALMSRKSLATDMDSLQRMVVDFAVDNRSSTTNTSPLSLADIELVRRNVREGDLTPVLKAYEHDLRTPFQGAIRGELIRALLIQIQKTKVDVEVAISGIDHLLKSQELVFGFVGLTPGILVSLVSVRWLASLFTSPGERNNATKGHLVRRLRNVDRILTGSAGMRNGNGGCLDYKEHGLLLCEVHALTRDAKGVFGRNIWREFTADLKELVDVRNGVKRQARVVERIRWTYGRVLC